MFTPRRRVARPRPATASAWIRSSPSRTHTFTSTSLPRGMGRSEEHTSELQSLMRISYAVFCLTKKKQQTLHKQTLHHTPQETTYNVPDKRQYTTVSQAQQQN